MSQMSEEVDVLRTVLFSYDSMRSVLLPALPTIPGSWTSLTIGMKVAKKDQMSDRHDVQ